ncbi:MAG: hypothetical protein PHV97_06375 [Candidatus Omnitrophica bacterium]|nr:hypothetical protein [Candidatus Omnitrophota bacterium]
MKKSAFFLPVIFFSLVCSPLCYGQDPSQDVSATANQILNLWCKSKMAGNASFDLDIAIKNAIDGKQVERFTDWDRLIRRVRAIQMDTKTPASTKLWSLLALNEVQWRLSNYLIKQASRELGDTIKTNKAKQAAARMEHWHEFKSVYKTLAYARAVLDNSQELFNANADREDFEKLKQGMVRQIDVFEAVVKASSDVAQAWDWIREDDEERKRTKKNYEKALEEQRLVNRTVQIYRKNKRAELLEKYGLGQWAFNAAQDLHQYAKDLAEK